MSEFASPQKAMQTHQVMVAGSFFQHLHRLLTPLKNDTLFFTDSGKAMVILGKVEIYYMKLTIRIQDPMILRSWGWLLAQALASHSRARGIAFIVSALVLLRVYICFRPKSVLVPNKDKAI